MDRPLCTCHNAPKSRNGRDEYGNQKWRCSVTSAERSRVQYDNLSGYARNKRLLVNRRRKALTRKQEREVMAYGALSP